MLQYQDHCQARSHYSGDNYENTQPQTMGQYLMTLVSWSTVESSRVESSRVESSRVESSRVESSRVV